MPSLATHPRYSNGLIGYAGNSKMSAIEAAGLWAHRAFAVRRKVDRFTQIEGNPLAIEFTLVNGTRWYRAEWDEAAEKYAIYML